uniref:Uncharacterized protein n=1 Tax=Anguilla anguilla TaxID=7936 RepID=A0A0E9XZ03_ANGAN
MSYMYYSVLRERTHHVVLLKKVH